jgi:hypothetical protein
MLYIYIYRIIGIYLRGGKIEISTRGRRREGNWQRRRRRDRRDPASTQFYWILKFELWYKMLAVGERCYLFTFIVSVSVHLRNWILNFENEMHYVFVIYIRQNKI